VYTNGSEWRNIISTVNGSYTNISGTWQNIISTINGSYTNDSLTWNNIISTINGIYGNASIAGAFGGDMYPINGSVGICPCCDPICIDVTAIYDFNMTVYGREQGESFWYVWNSYTDIAADEYCFCMDSIMPTMEVHAVAHSHTNHTVDAVDRWYNITFDHGDAEGMVAIPATGTVIIPSYGHYTATYWCAVKDDSVNPEGNYFAIRVIQNDTDELEGSYRETQFSKKGKEQHISGSIHSEFYPGTTLRFQYIGDDTDQTINITGTWSNDNLCFYAYIEKTSPIEETKPMKYNTTYEWYVNISKFDDSSLYNETDTFSFTTASDWVDCIPSSGGGGGGGVVINKNTEMIGLMGIIGIIGLSLIHISEPTRPY